MWFFYAKEINSLDVEYDDCGTICAEGEQTKSNSFCEECPVRAARESFKDSCIEALETAAAGKWQKWGFDNLKKYVEEIADLVDMPKSDRSCTTHWLISEFQSARNRFEKIQTANEKQTN